jgi:hypothetical protein
MFGVILALSLAQPVLAQNTGLLLGIDGDNGARTLWITRESGGRVAAAGELQRLIVPRADGFWWLDVDRRCSSHDSDADDPDNPLFINKEAFVVLAKVDGEPAVTADGEPLTENPNYGNCDAIGQQILKREKSRRHMDDLADLYCIYDTIELTHVSGRYISYRNHLVSTEFCNPAKYTSSTYLRVEDFNQQRIGLLDALTPAERTSLLETWERQKGDYPQERSPDESWAIAPIEGEWRATFATAGDIAHKGQSGGEFTVTVRVPSSIVRQDSAKPWAAEVAKLQSAQKRGR